MTNCNKCGREIFWSKDYKSKYRHFIPLEKITSGQLQRHNCPKHSRIARYRVDRKKQFYALWL